MLFRSSPESTVMIYLLMLYWLLPALLSAAGLRAVANLLVPMPTGNSGLALLAALGQVALVGWLVVRRWQARQSPAGPGN